jgi:hypothetical protein
VPLTQISWIRHIVPERGSERSALVSFLVGFALEAASELYQFTDRGGTPAVAVTGYVAGLAAALLGFYFFWRGGFEWRRLPHDRAKVFLRRPARVSIVLAILGTGAVVVWNFVTRTVGAGETPFPLAWLVGGAFVWAVALFFLSLRDRVRPFHGTGLAIPGWIALAWAFGVATISGLLLGQAIVGLFVDFFTNWTELFDALGPFIYAVSPLFVAFALIGVVYTSCLSRTSPRRDFLARTTERRPR